MKLRADVRTATGATRHVIAGRPMPVPTWVQIEPAEHPGAHYLLYIAGDGTVMTDTWHESLQLAKQAAAIEFEVGDDDWRRVD